MKERTKENLQITVIIFIIITFFIGLTYYIFYNEIKIKKITKTFLVNIQQERYLDALMATDETFKNSYTLYDFKVFTEKFTLDEINDFKINNLIINQNKKTNLKTAIVKPTIFTKNKEFNLEIKFTKENNDWKIRSIIQPSIEIKDTN